MLSEMNLVEELIDQINQFSRMHWKSTEPLAIEKVKTK
jgi:hypothetical protein